MTLAVAAHEEPVEEEMTPAMRERQRYYNTEREREAAAAAVREWVVRAEEERVEGSMEGPDTSTEEGADDDGEIQSIATARLVSASIARVTPGCDYGRCAWNTITRGVPRELLVRIYREPDARSNATGPWTSVTCRWDRAVWVRYATKPRRARRALGWRPLCAHSIRVRARRKRQRRAEQVGSRTRLQIPRRRW